MPIANTYLVARVCTECRYDQAKLRVMTNGTASLRCAACQKPVAMQRVPERKKKTK